MDRWQAWGELAISYGSGRLTHHLLEVAAAALADDTLAEHASQRIAKD